MPVFLLAWAAKLGIPPQFRKGAVIVVGAILLSLAIAGGVKLFFWLHDRQVISSHEAKQDAANAKADRKADANAAVRRRADDQRTADEIQQVKEAINEAGNDPAARRAAYYRCVGLQQAARAKRERSPEC